MLFAVKQGPHCSRDLVGGGMAPMSAMLSSVRNPETAWTERIPPRGTVRGGRADNGRAAEAA